MKERPLKSIRPCNRLLRMEDPNAAQVRSFTLQCSRSIHPDRVCALIVPICKEPLTTELQQARSHSRGPYQLQKSAQQPVAFHSRPRGLAHPCSVLPASLTTMSGNLANVVVDKPTCEIKKWRSKAHHVTSPYCERDFESALSSLLLPHTASSPAQTSTVRHHGVQGGQEVEKAQVARC